MSGTGKSTVLAELARRGYRVVDTNYGGGVKTWRCPMASGQSGSGGRIE